MLPPSIRRRSSATDCGPRPGLPSSKRRSTGRNQAHQESGQRPRVFFGEDWVQDSVLELFRDNISHFRVVIIGDGEPESSHDLLAQGRLPPLSALCLHSGTVYRWNRPCYGLKRRSRALAHRKPSTAVRAHRGGRNGQRGFLLWPHDRPRVAHRTDRPRDAVRRRQDELLRRFAARSRRAAALARGAFLSGEHAHFGPVAAPSRTRASNKWPSTPKTSTGTSASSSSE